MQISCFPSFFTRVLLELFDIWYSKFKIHCTVPVHVVLVSIMYWSTMYVYLLQVATMCVYSEVRHCRRLPTGVSGTVLLTNAASSIQYSPVYQ